jgi:hypothetical protein
MAPEGTVAHGKVIVGTVLADIPIAAPDSEIVSVSVRRVAVSVPDIEVAWVLLASTAAGWSLDIEVENVKVHSVHRAAGWSLDTVGIVSNVMGTAHHHP